MSVIPFQVSLINPSTNQLDVSVLNNCTSVIFNDWSNYTTSTESGNEAADFTNFRIITVTYYAPGTPIFLSTQATPPTMSPYYPLNVVQFTEPLLTGDGWYSVILQTVPTWNSGSISYVAGTHQVYDPADGNLYTCITSNTSSGANAPHATPADWQLISVGAYNTSIFAKYQAIGFFATTCNANGSNGLPALIATALCNNPNFPCNNTTLCSSPSFLNAIGGVLLLYSINWANNINQIQMTSNTFDLLNEIVLCNSTNEQTNVTDG